MYFAVHAVNVFKMFLICLTIIVILLTYLGPLVKELQWQLNDWISGGIRMYDGKWYLEYDWTIGPIPVE